MTNDINQKVRNILGNQPATNRQILLELAVIFLVSLPIGIPFGFLIIKILVAGAVTGKMLFALFIVSLSLFLTLQGLFTLFWMLFAWEDPDEVESNASPLSYVPPYYSFTALVPARNEEQVIADTIAAVNRIDYPTELKEVLVLCRVDDTKTIESAQRAIVLTGNGNVRLELFDGVPVNKPRALNIGLARSANSIVTIFDAEDEPHPDIYNIINTTMHNRETDVIQSGVQLTNLHTRWFSTLNCLEYFFWFKSGLHFFTKVGKVTPLGGNSVFFKRELLESVNGWDESCLTEDADIGFRLVRAGANISVIYDEKHVTREETPYSVTEFIKQRTRWNQGFLQIFFKGDWARLPSMLQKIVAFYILVSPEFQALLFLYAPIAIWLSLHAKLPVIISLFSFLPLILFLLQVITLTVGLYEFTKAYKFKFSPLAPIKIILAFYPYQLLLMFSALRALYRFVFSLNSWEKTLHKNAHRTQI